MAVGLFCSEGAAPDIAAQALAPTGTLRIALLPLPQIALRDQLTGQFSGVVVDLGRELAKRLDVRLEFVAANSNVAAVDQIKKGHADITFLVGLPELAAQIDFGPPYIEYETSFLVRADSPVSGLEDIDAPGFRIIVPEKGVSEAKLRQTLKNVKLIGEPIAIGAAQRVAELLKNGEADAYSNLTHLLSLAQPNLPGWRIVPGSYMMTVFSIGYPKDRPFGADYVHKFIEEMKNNGFIQQSIDRANLEGAVVPK